MLVTTDCNVCHTGELCNTYSTGELYTVQVSYIQYMSVFISPQAVLRCTEVKTVNS